MINEIINQLTSKLINEKENAIKKALFEYLGYELDIKQESKKRFPRLCIILQEGEESYYWNDDTDNGKRIITFCDGVSNMNFSQNAYSLESKISYY